MEERKLKAFLTAVQTGSLRRTAEVLHCTQSAVTQMMNGLEAELGCRLLERDHRGVTLTSAGKVLLPAIEEIMRRMEALREQAGQLGRSSKQPLRIGSFASIANSWLPKAMQAYQQRYPESRFSLHIGTDQLGGWLEQGKIDLALGDETRCGAQRWQPLMEDPYMAVLPAAMCIEGRQSISQQELVQYPFLMAPGNALEAHLQQLPAQSLQVSCDDDAALLALVAQGIGVTAVPRLSLQQLPSQVRALDIRPPMQRCLGIALPLTGKVIPEAERFAEFLCRYMAQEQSKGL